jgi:hypothetical protein
MRPILFILLLFVIAACKKNRFQTIPQLKLKSLNTTVVPFNGSLRAIIEFTSKASSVSDTFYIKKIRLNRRVVATVRDSFYYKVPTYPSTQKGEFQVDLDYQTILSAINPPIIPGSVPPTREPDTLIVKFAVKDKSNNISDTIATPQIVVIRQ